MDNSVLKLIGQRVRDIRKQKGLSQERLGELAGFHFSYIGGLERGEKNLSLLNLEKIAIALDVPIIELFNYGRRIKQIRGNDKDELITDIYEKLIGLDAANLRKLQRIIDELFT